MLPLLYSEHSFNLKSRESGFELGVNSGIVSVSNGIKNITLLKGQLINLKSDLDDDLTPPKNPIQTTQTGSIISSIAKKHP